MRHIIFTASLTVASGLLTSCFELDFFQLIPRNSTKAQNSKNKQNTTSIASTTEIDTVEVNKDIPKWKNRCQEQQSADLPHRMMGSHSSTFPSTSANSSLRNSLPPTIPFHNLEIGVTQTDFEAVKHLCNTPWKQAYTPFPAALLSDQKLPHRKGCRKRTFSTSQFLSSDMKSEEWRIRVIRVIRGEKIRESL